MKIIILTVFVLSLVFTASAQFVVKMETIDDIQGLCDKKNVYILFHTLQGQEESECPVSKDEILRRLNTEVTFLKEHPKTKIKAMVDMIINCKGEVVQCKLNKKSKYTELNKQIIAVFSSLGTWKAGKLNGKEVDTSQMFSIVIKKGKVIWEQ